MSDLYACANCGCTTERDGDDLRDAQDFLRRRESVDGWAFCLASATNLSIMEDAIILYIAVPDRPVRNVLLCDPCPVHFPLKYGPERYRKVRIGWAQVLKVKRGILQEKKRLEKQSSNIYT